AFARTHQHHMVVGKPGHRGEGAGLLAGRLARTIFARRDQRGLRFDHQADDLFNPAAVFEEPTAFYPLDEITEASAGGRWRRDAHERLGSYGLAKQFEAGLAAGIDDAEVSLHQAASTRDLVGRLEANPIPAGRRLKQG